MGAIYRTFFSADSNSVECRRRIIYVIISTLALGTVLLMIVLLALCVNVKVSQSEVGVFINSFSAEVRGPFEQGTYTIRPGDVVRRYARVYQQRTYSSVSCLTSDALNVSVDIAMQYQYQPAAIVSIMLPYFDDESNYMNVFDNIFFKSYLISCAKYTAEQFYNIRAQVERDITAEMLSFIGNISYISAGIDVQSVQLLHTYFPQSFVDVVAQKQATAQNITTNLNARSGQVTSANTNILQALQQAQQMMIAANNSAAITVQTADIQYAVVMNQYTQLATAFQDVMQSLNNDADAFMQYLQYAVLSNSSNTVINFQSFIDP